MNPYSHLVIAAKLEQSMAPEKPSEYYWGAVAPDIRYLAAIQRSQTHLSSQRIAELVRSYPHQSSFLQGYLVHCLADEINLSEIFFRHFPFIFLKSKLSRQQTAVILELYYLENEQIDQEIRGGNNEVLADIGLQAADCERFSEFIEQYMQSKTMDARIQGLVQLLGLENDSRIERYLSAAKRFQKHWLMKRIMFIGIRSGKISEEITFRVSSLLNNG